MPVMNGLKLVEETKKALSGSDQCHCQWISGIRICKTGYRIWGVRLYPETDRAVGIFQTDRTRIEEKLRQKHYKERNTLMHKMVNEIPIDEKTLRKIFSVRMLLRGYCKTERASQPLWGTGEKRRSFQTSMR